MFSIRFSSAADSAVDTNHYSVKQRKSLVVWRIFQSLPLR